MAEIIKAVSIKLGYIHGISEILSAEVAAELVGHIAGGVIKLPVDIGKIYGPRDESLVFTDSIENLTTAVATLPIEKSPQTFQRCLG